MLLKHQFSLSWTTDSMQSQSKFAKCFLEADTAISKIHEETQRTKNSWPNTMFWIYCEILFQGLFFSHINQDSALMAKKKKGQNTNKTGKLK